MKSSSQGRILSSLLSLETICQPLSAPQTRLDGAKVSEQVKSHKRGKPLHQRISDMPSGRSPSSQQTASMIDNSCKDQMQCAAIHQV